MLIEDSALFMEVRFYFVFSSQTSLRRLQCWNLIYGLILLCVLKILRKEHWKFKVIFKIITRRKMQLQLVQIESREKAIIFYCDLLITHLLLYLLIRATEKLSTIKDRID